MAAKRAAKERSTAPTTAAEHHFYVTRDSQDADKKKPDSQKLSYVGVRDLTDLDMIDEQDILSASGTIRGKKNRVRAGLANFENPKALEKVTKSYLCASIKRGWGSILHVCFLTSAQHRSGASGGVRHHFSRSSCDFRGVSLRSRPLPQPAHSRGYQGHLHVPVLPQRAGREIKTQPPALLRATGLHWRATHRGMYVTMVAI